MTTPERRNVLAKPDDPTLDSESYPDERVEKLAFKTKRLAQHRWRVLEATRFQEKLRNADGG